MKRHAVLVWFVSLGCASIVANFAQAYASYWLVKSFAPITFASYFSTIVTQMWIGTLFAVGLQLLCIWLIAYLKNNPARFVYVAFLVLSAGTVLYSLAARVPYLFFMAHPPVGMAGSTVLLLQFLQPLLQIAAAVVLFTPAMNHYVGASKNPRRHASKANHAH